MLFLSPFGYEELCSRRFWTALADDLGRAGFASLRFDFPGTGDALDLPPRGLDDWKDAARSAAAHLRARTSAEKITLVGQGLGGSLALLWAADLGPLADVVLLEPAVSGRLYLRGLKAWAKALAAGAGIGNDPADANGFAVAGMPLPQARADAIAGLDLMQASLTPGSRLLICERPGSAALRKLADRLSGEGVDVTTAPFAEYDALLTDPTSAPVATAAIASITGWLSRQLAPQVNAPAPHSPGAPPRLHGDGFVEIAMRFGAGDRLAGFLCVPVGAHQPSRAVVIANAGRDYHIGWARSTVSQARALARSGIASLRFDVSGIGDSRMPDGTTTEVLYSQQQIADTRAAVDAMAAAGFLEVGLIGRCSGAWAAFTEAADDPRVTSLFLTNTLAFIWDASKDFDEVLRFSQRSVGDLGATFLKRDGLRRLLAGQLNVRGALRFLHRQLMQQVMRRFGFLMGGLTAESRRYREGHRLFAQLDRRGVKIQLAYAEGDAGLRELASYMGDDLRRLDRYANAQWCEIKGADHNFTHHSAREALEAEMIAFFGSKEAAASLQVPAKAAA